MSTEIWEIYISPSGRVFQPFVLMLAAMIVLPLLLDVNGIWLATWAAKRMALFLPAGMCWKYRKRYGY